MGRTKRRTPELREQLLDGAIGLVTAGGPRALTTRAVATRAGTSMPALHELFGGKPGLVRAIFTRGFERLATTFDRVPRSGEPVSDLTELAWAFRAFARDEPHLFAVMFSRPFGEFEPGPDDLVAARSIHRHVVERTAALLGSDASPGDCKDAAIALFALVQGLANLELSGLLGSGEASIERRWRLAVRTAIQGLLADAREEP